MKMNKLRDFYLKNEEVIKPLVMYMMNNKNRLIIRDTDENQSLYSQCIIEALPTVIKEKIKVKLNGHIDDLSEYQIVGLSLEADLPQGNDVYLDQGKLINEPFFLEDNYTDDYFIVAEDYDGTLKEIDQYCEDLVPLDHTNVYKIVTVIFTILDLYEYEDIAFDIDIIDSYVIHGSLLEKKIVKTLLEKYTCFYWKREDYFFQFQLLAYIHQLSLRHDDQDLIKEVENLIYDVCGDLLRPGNHNSQALSCVAYFVKFDPNGYIKIDPHLRPLAIKYLNSLDLHAVQKMVNSVIEYSFAPSRKDDYRQFLYTIYSAYINELDPASIQDIMAYLDPKE